MIQTATERHAHVCERARGLVFVMMVLACAGLTWTPESSAHVSLSATSPEAGATLAAPPDAVSLTFTGAVRATGDAVHVFRPDGSSAEAGSPRMRARDEQVEQRLAPTPAGDATGTWAVAWRVTSDDGHTEIGSFTFVVGTASEDAAAAVERQVNAATDVSRTALVAANVSRSLAMVGLLVAVGGVLFAAVVAPGWWPRWIGWSMAALLAGLTGNFIADAAISHGTSMLGALDADTLVDEIANPYGRGALVTAALCVLCSALLPLLRHGRDGVAPSRAARSFVAVSFVLMGASISLAGHAAATTPMAIRLPLDMVHVIAASFWFGGLLQLSALVPEASLRLHWIHRFSNLAFVCVVALLLTGIYAAWVEIETFEGLLDGRYGSILAGKVLLYVGTVPLAWLNRSTLVPAMESSPAMASQLLRQYVRRELVLLVAVVALTAWLVGTNPGG